MPSNAGAKPIVASQKIKKVERAYGRLVSEEFLVTIVVQAEFNVPKPNERHIAQMNIVTYEGAIAIRKIPALCAMIPVTQIIMSP